MAAKKSTTKRKVATRSKKSKPKTYKGKSLRKGGGGRFAKRVDELMAKGMSKDQAEGEAAKEGRAKYGKGQFQKMAATGRRRAARKRKKGK